MLLHTRAFSQVDGSTRVKPHENTFRKVLSRQDFADIETATKIADNKSGISE